MSGGSTVPLRTVPITLRAAAAFVACHHRRHGPPQGHKFSIAVRGPREVHGVVIVGRPVARHLDDGVTAEVTRLATDGTPNACSVLLGAAWRAARAMGYRRMITYTRADESGASLRAAGFVRLGVRPARSGWDCPARPRRAHGTDSVERVLWQITRNEGEQP